MPKDEDVLQLAYSQDVHLRGKDSVQGGVRNLSEPPPLCYPHKTYPGIQPQNQQHLGNWPSPPLDNRCGGEPWELGHSSPAHRTKEIQYGMTCRGRGGRSVFSSYTTSPPPPQHQNQNHSQGSEARLPSLQPRPARRQAQLCQQALSAWLSSQQGPHRAMPPRQRSFSQDRLGDLPPLSHFRGPRTTSQDFLLHQQHWGHLSGSPGVTGAFCWSGAGRERLKNQLAGRRELLCRSLETLDRAVLSPLLQRPAWLQQQGQHGRFGIGTSAPTNRERAPQPQLRSRERGRGTRRLPPQQRFKDTLVGYHKTDLPLSTHCFRDPSCTGTIPKASPFPLLLAQDGVRIPANHERGRRGVSQIQRQVVLKQVAPMGWRTSHYVLPSDPPMQARATEGDTGLRSANRDDDSLASIPFIDEKTSPRADLRARHVPASSVVSNTTSSAPLISTSSAPLITTSSASPTFTFPLTRLFSHDCSSIKASRRSSHLLMTTMERSKSCDEGLDTFRDEGRIFSRLPQRVKNFFTHGSLDSLAAAQEACTTCHSTSELSNLAFSDVRREGWLHYKQILTEKGKKVGSGMRSWKRVFFVLRSHALFLYKDKREAVLFNPAHSEDEQPISICGCLVDVAYSETKRKHALRLTTQDFCEYLLQAEDRDDMLGWIKGIRENSRTGAEDSVFCGQAIIHKKLNDYRKQSPTGSKPDSSPKGTRMKPPFLTATGAPRSPKQDSGNKEDSSPPKSPWGINFMKKVKKSGPKAFGVRLEDCQHGVNEKFVPLIVELCCGQVEDMGLECTGIYRVPGNNAVVSSLQEQLNKGSIDINPADEKWQDLNVISSLLKSFFRKLPEPLFTDDKYSDFIDANRMEEAGERLKTMKKLIRGLPDYYFHTLKFLVAHLKTVADHSEKNKMEPRNLALVFGPTLVRTSGDNITDMVKHMPDRYKIVETLIQHHSWFFSEEMANDDKAPVDKSGMQPVPNIDHLLPNIGRTGGLGEASDSTNSDSKSKGSWGREQYSRESLDQSILSAVTRKRKKHRDARVWDSSTDEDSEHEPIKTSHHEGQGLEGEGAGEREEKGQETGGERQRDGPGGKEDSPSLDARSIVSGYSTLSMLGGHGGEDADDECSELLSESGMGLPETDTESGFASHPQTQERPPKQDRQRRDQEQQQQFSQLRPHSFLYSHCTPPGSPRSDSPSSLSSSTAPRPHSQPSFSSCRPIQCDMLSCKQLREEEEAAVRVAVFSADSTGSSSSKVSIPRVECSSLESLRQGGEAGVSAFLSLASAGKPLPRPHSSVDDMFGLGLRKPHSPETRRKKAAWRRHTVVGNTRGTSETQSSSTLSKRGSEGRPRSGSYGNHP
ncbi:rho GTPase-activating protein 23-like isoform X2 [Polyodon spathula]|uniref:rho GTPase-activating protein 23-like isoform X2 n=1 Tax=Polyodon spathula TaxID=7913 RepID=UPI001B7E9BD7|nr:rho GTPase-activating protein 23-like isoform X2 [Polyodon spathula]